MSWKEELRRAREEEHNAQEQRKAKELELLRVRRAEAQKTNALVTTLLDGVGMIQWGKGLLGKRYKISDMDYHGLSERTKTDHAEWKVYKKGIMRRRTDCYSIRLYLDPYGHPSHFEVSGKERRLTEGVSEDALREAIKEVFSKGPHTGFSERTSA